MKLPSIPFREALADDPAVAARLARANRRALVGFVATILVVAVFAGPTAERLAVAAAAASVLALVTGWLTQRGYPRLASAVQVGTVWALALVLAVTAGGARAPVFLALLVITAYSTWVFSLRTNLLIVAANLAVGVGLALAENAGWLPPAEQHPGWLQWATFGPIMAAVVIFQLQAVHLMRTIVVQAGAQAAEIRRLAMVASETTNAVVITDLSQRIEWANAGFTRLTGYALDEVRGRTPDFLHGPGTDPAALAQVRRQLDEAAPIVSAEVLNYHKSGRPYWVQFTLQPLRDEHGARVGYMEIETDITDRKTAEAALRESDTRNRTILEVLSEGVVMHDARGVITYANASAERLLSSSSQALLGRTALDPAWQPVHADGTPFPAEAHPVQVTLRTGQPFNDVVMGFTPPAGTQTWISINTRPIWAGDEAGAPAAVVASFTDITQRLAAEAAAHRLQASLEGRVAERTAELQAAYEALARGNRLKDDFLASMSHELRTPLTGVLGLTEALQRSVYGALTDKQLEILRAVDTSGRHLLALINDLLDYSKLEAGRLSLVPGPVSAAAAARASLSLVGPAARAKRQSVSLSITAPAPRLTADLRRLKQILVNLLANAVKFTPEGGALGLEVATLAGQVVFTVWDTGIGIPPADQARLFQPFVQLDSGLARQYAGAGLGLALVKRLAELHGGQVRVHSAVAAGSRFTVTLPWQGESAGPEEDGATGAQWALTEELS